MPAPPPRLPRHRLARWTERMRRFSGRRWLVPATGVGTAADSFLPVVPTQSLLIVLALLHPAQWLRTGLWFALGGTIGGAAVAWTVGHFGSDLAERMMEGATGGFATRVREWIRTHGPWALGLLALGPWPVRSAVALCALSGASWPAIALALALGRTVAFPGLAWVVGRRPTWLTRLRRFARGRQARNRTTALRSACASSVRPIR